jgi:hypothetical protein
MYIGVGFYSIVFSACMFAFETIYGLKRTASQFPVRASAYIM